MREEIAIPLFVIGFIFMILSVVYIASRQYLNRRTIDII